MIESQAYTFDGWANTHPNGTPTNSSGCEHELRGMAMSIHGVLKTIEETRTNTPLTGFAAEQLIEENKRILQIKQQTDQREQALNDLQAKLDSRESELAKDAADIDRQLAKYNEIKDLKKKFKELARREAYINGREKAIREDLLRIQREKKELEELKIQRAGTKPIADFASFLEDASDDEE
jgi:DNA repair exonuclease SbcCD ATPase subunit